MRILLLIVAMLVAAFLLLSRFNPLELKLKAGLQVTTDNVPASLFLDSEYLDKAPFTSQKIQPKQYLLRIEPDEAGLAPYDLSVTLNKGMVTVVKWKPGPTAETSGGVIYEMEKLRNANDIQIYFQTVPDGAILTLDNGGKQFSPVLITDLSEGSHEFEVSLPSFETQQHSVSLIKGHKVTITIILGKLRAGDAKTVPAESGTQPADGQTSLSQALGPRVQILSTNFFFNNQEVLRVRDAASPAGAELGFAPVGSSYPYLDETSGWFQINFDDQPGWVSAQFSQKIATDSTQPAQ